MWLGRVKKHYIGSPIVCITQCCQSNVGLLLVWVSLGNFGWQCNQHMENFWTSLIVRGSFSLTSSSLFTVVSVKVVFVTDSVRSPAGLFRPRDISAGTLRFPRRLKIRWSGSFWIVMRGKCVWFYKIEGEIPVRDEGVKLIVGEVWVGWQCWRASRTWKTPLRTISHGCSTLLVLPWSIWSGWSLWWSLWLW